MMRPSNWASRWPESVWMVLIRTVKLAVVTVVTVVPAMTSWPVTELLRPTAVWDCPARISWTRYPTCEPEPTRHAPATGAAAAGPVPEPGAALAPRLSRAGALPSTKWKNTNGTPTASTTTATAAPITHRSQRRRLRDGTHAPPGRVTNRRRGPGPPGPGTCPAPEGSRSQVPDGWRIALRQLSARPVPARRGGDLAVHAGRQRTPPGS